MKRRQTGKGDGVAVLNHSEQLPNRLTKNMFNLCLPGSENSSSFLLVAFAKFAKSLKYVTRQINQFVFWKEQTVNGRKHVVFLVSLGNDISPWLREMSKHPPT